MFELILGLGLVASLCGFFAIFVFLVVKISTWAQNRCYIGSNAPQAIQIRARNLAQTIGIYDNHILKRALDDYLRYVAIDDPLASIRTWYDEFSTVYYVKNETDHDFIICSLLLFHKWDLDSKMERIWKAKSNEEHPNWKRARLRVLMYLCEHAISINETTGKIQVCDCITNDILWTAIEYCTKSKEEIKYPCPSTSRYTVSKTLPVERKFAYEKISDAARAWNIADKTLIEIGISSYILYVRILLDFSGRPHEEFPPYLYGEYDEEVEGFAFSILLFHRHRIETVMVDLWNSTKRGSHPCWRNAKIAVLEYIRNSILNKKENTELLSDSSKQRILEIITECADLHEEKMNPKPQTESITL